MFKIDEANKKNNNKCGSVNMAERATQTFFYFVRGGGGSICNENVPINQKVSYMYVYAKYNYKRSTTWLYNVIQLISNITQIISR